MVKFEITADNPGDVVKVVRGITSVEKSAVVNLSVDDLSEESVEEAVRKVNVSNIARDILDAQERENSTSRRSAGR